MAETVTDADLKAFGYVPGDYLCRCVEHGCKTMEFCNNPRSFIAAKFAYRCEPCATAKLQSARRPASPEGK